MSKRRRSALNADTDFLESALYSALHSADMHKFESLLDRGADLKEIGTERLNVILRAHYQILGRHEN